MSDRVASAVEWYRGLPAAARAGLWGLLAVEAVLIAGAQRDIQRRPPASVRGPKLLWRVVATQNLIGPAAYYLFGRRRTRENF